jgi:hypothetical protein
MWTTLWLVLNSPLAMLVMGSGSACLFTKFVWEPFQLRKGAHLNRKPYRDEARFRLHSFATRMDGRADQDLTGAGQRV